MKELLFKQPDSEGNVEVFLLTFREEGKAGPADKIDRIFLTRLNCCELIWNIGQGNEIKFTNK